MRVAAGFLSVFCLGTMTQALAEKPTSTSPSPTQNAATPSAPADSKSVVPAASDSSSVKAAAVSAADAEKEKADTTARDKELRSRGYKVQVRNGEKYFCRMEAPVGSHLEKKECYTAASIYAQEESSQEMVRRMQSYSPKVSN